MNQQTGLSPDSQLAGLNEAKHSQLRRQRAAAVGTGNSTSPEDLWPRVRPELAEEPTHFGFRLHRWSVLLPPRR